MLDKLFGKAVPPIPGPDQALPGRDTPVDPGRVHAVLGAPLAPPYPTGMETLVLGLGCFWGAERLFWQVDGVYVTAVGYAGGTTPNPTYREVCTGMTGHTEVVLVVYDPARVGCEALIRRFFESHDPTHGMRQGNDVGTQYRSAIYTTSPEQTAVAQGMCDAYGAQLTAAGFPPITTEIREGVPVYFAEEYHQQYLHKNPHGYCGLAGTGIACPAPA
mgnify:CR=1 FL=1